MAIGVTSKMAQTEAASGAGNAKDHKDEKGNQASQREILRGGPSGGHLIGPGPLVWGSRLVLGLSR